MTGIEIRDTLLFGMVFAIWVKFLFLPWRRD